MLAAQADGGKLGHVCLPGKERIVVQAGCGQHGCTVFPLLVSLSWLLGLGWQLGRIACKSQACPNFLTARIS